MKLIKPLVIATIGCVILASCQKEITEKSTKSADVIAQMGLSAKMQKPVALFDADKKKGIYHGVLASGTSQDRGKFWCNLENNGSLDAYAEMVDGTNIKYTGTKEKKSSVYTFVSTVSSFTVDVSSGVPVFGNVVKDGKKYFIKAYKHTSKNNVKTVTGRFSSDKKGDLTGTWNLLSDGNLVDPNGHGGEAITSVVVTMNGKMMVDDSFELINGTCIPVPDAIPQLSDNSDAGLIGAYNQTSNFEGKTNWSLVFCLGHYLDAKCGRTDSGTFEWTSNEGDTYDGIIFVDDLGV